MTSDVKQIEKFISQSEKDKLFQDLTAKIPTMYLNNKFNPTYDVNVNGPVKYDLIEDAAFRLERFSDFFKVAFPETANSNGIIESNLVEIPTMNKSIKDFGPFDGRLLLKMDSHLPISGSIKARGGIYEVVKHAETILLNENMIRLDDCYEKIADKKIADFLNKYKVAVGSTGNLGLSIGIMSSKLGFKAEVHMSSDAKAWKKNLLRTKGVNVIEYDDDYSVAVENGRATCSNDPFCHFVDDENSLDLFLGYAVVGRRMKKQLEDMGITINEDNPLFVYLPCGVGGGPGGVAYGLKEAFGDNVYPIFAEPTESPCMLLGIYSGLHESIAVSDIGLSNKTALDGLAVGRPSGFVGKVIEEFTPLFYTLDDSITFSLLKMLKDTENICLEPSALAGMIGPSMLTNTDAGKEFINKYNLSGKMKNAVHIVWATGGSMVPKDEMDKYLSLGN